MHKYSVLEIQSLFSFKIRWHRFTSIIMWNKFLLQFPTALISFCVNIPIHLLLRDKYPISTTDSNNLKTLCAQGAWLKTNIRCLWCPCEQTRFCFGNVMPEIMVCEHSSPLHPQMLVKPLLCSVMQRRSHMCTWSRNMFTYVVPTVQKIILMDWSNVKNCGQTNWNLKFFIKIMDSVSSGLKSRRTIHLVISLHFKRLHHWGTRGH